MTHRSPRIALVHDYLKEYGGAESTFETLSDIFPAADIFTTVYRPAFFGPHRSRLEKKWNHRLHQSFFSFIPFAEILLSPLRFLSPLAFWSFDFRGYDVIITSATGAFFPNSLRKGKAKLICYCHTPPRYLYRLATARSLDNWFFRLVNIPLQFTLHFYRLFDFKFSQNVDQFIANSRTTAARITKFYRRDSIIINPPVDLPENLTSDKLRSAFYLTGGRLTFAKRFDIAISACSKLNLPLKVFGRDFAGTESSLRAIAGPTVEFLGEIDQATKNKLFAQARAFIFPSDNEDFGIVSVEAQSFGCPVVGYRSGGIAETVIDGKTGVLFDDLTVDSCVTAIKKLQKLKLKPSDSITNSRRFSKETFVSKITKFLTKFDSNLQNH